MSRSSSINGVSNPAYQSVDNDATSSDEEDSDVEDENEQVIPAGKVVPYSCCELFAQGMRAIGMSILWIFSVFYIAFFVGFLTYTTLHKVYIPYLVWLFFGLLLFHCVIFVYNRFHGIPVFTEFFNHFVGPGLNLFPRGLVE